VPPNCLSIFSRRPAHHLPKTAGEVVAVLKSARLGDIADASVFPLFAAQFIGGAPNAGLHQVIGRCCTDGETEAAVQGALGHPHLAGQIGDGEGTVQLRFDPTENAAKSVFRADRQSRFFAVEAAEHSDDQRQISFGEERSSLTLLVGLLLEAVGPLFNL